MLSRLLVKAKCSSGHTKHFLLLTLVPWECEPELGGWGQGGSWWQGTQGWRLSGGVLTVSQAAASCPGSAEEAQRTLPWRWRAKTRESEEAGPTALGGQACLLARGESSTQ